MLIIKTIDTNFFCFFFVSKNDREKILSEFL
jgi:hypothetical protein